MTESNSPSEPRLAATYDEARKAVAAAGARAGMDATSFPHPSPGRGGEELAIDVAHSSAPTTPTRYS